MSNHHRARIAAPYAQLREQAEAAEIARYLQDNVGQQWIDRIVSAEGSYGGPILCTERDEANRAWERQASLDYWRWRNSGMR